MKESPITKQYWSISTLSFVVCKNFCRWAKVNERVVSDNWSVRLNNLLSSERSYRHLSNPTLYCRPHILVVHIFLQAFFWIVTVDALHSTAWYTENNVRAIVYFFTDTAEKFFCFFHTFFAQIFFRWGYFLKKLRHQSTPAIAFWKKMKVRKNLFLPSLKF